MRIALPTIKDINNFISPRLQQEYNLIGKNLASFLSHADHESQGFTRLVENLNYSSADRLIEIFPKYFNTLNAWSYVNKPQAVANLVYANRMGNGDINSGDGWNYRGHGYFMLTGRDMYLRCGEDIQVDILSEPNLVSNDKKISLLTTIWIWQDKKMQDCDIETSTKRLNGGKNGLNERIILYKTYVKLLKV